MDTAVNLRAHFIRRAGILFGAFFAIAFTLIMLGFDAQALRQASAHLWWGKLAIGFALILPVSILTGWWAAAARWAGYSILLWIITGAVLVWIVGHLPYEGLSWLSGLDDPYPNAQMMYPFLLPSAGTTGIAMVIG
ncbi:MAG TPA: hypothetical protein VFK30_07830, partial [Anaerolineae bacterium]|nr:hypothetical protein [Anaerolineae bacterium]